MHARENAEEIAVEGGSVRNARITQQDGENGGESDPEDHYGHHLGGCVAVQALDHQAGQRRRILGFAPGYDAENTGLQSEVEQGDTEDGKKNSTRDVALGLANLSAKVADVVVAPVGVHRLDHSGA